MIYWELEATRDPGSGGILYKSPASERSAVQALGKPARIFDTNADRVARDFRNDAAHPVPLGDSHLRLAAHLGAGLCDRTPRCGVVYAARKSRIECRSRWFD